MTSKKTMPWTENRTEQEIHDFVEFIRAAGDDDHFLRGYNKAGMELQENALFAWAEIALLPESKPLPQWVRAYLHLVALRLLQLQGDRSISATKAAGKVAGALNLVRNASDKWNAFGDMRACKQALDAAIAVERNSHHRQREIAIEDVALLIGKSKRTIFRWIKNVENHRNMAEEHRGSNEPSSE